MDLSNVQPLRSGDAVVPFRENLDTVKLGLDMDIMSFENPLVVEGTMTFTGDDLLMEARAVGTKNFACSRCLKEFSEDFAKDVFLNFEFEDGHSINVLPELSEELLVDSPIHVLCKEDCRGLCSRCGSDLNAGPCACPKPKA